MKKIKYTPDAAEKLRKIKKTISQNFTEKIMNSEAGTFLESNYAVFDARA